MADTNPDANPERLTADPSPSTPRRSSAANVRFAPGDLVSDYYRIVSLLRRIANVHTLDRQGLTMRLQSMTYVPREREGWDRMRDELALLFERYADGARSLPLHDEHDSR